MIQLLYGENDYALRQAEGRIRDAFVDKHGEHSVALLQGDALTPADLPQLLQGGTLFAVEKLSVIYDASANKPLWESLGEFLESTRDVDLLLVETKPDKRTKTFKWLQKNAETQECKLLDERTTVSWLQTEARRQGIELGSTVAAFLVHHSGTDQWRLYHDLMKLSLAEAPITQDLIRQIIEPHPTTSVFDVLTSVVRGDSAEALEAVGILKTYEDPYKFFGLLVSQLYTLAVCVTSDRRPSQQIAKDTGIHPYALSQTAKVAQHVDRDRLNRMVLAFDRCDERMKSSGADPWLLIEAAIGQSA